MKIIYSEKDNKESDEKEITRIIELFK